MEQRQPADDRQAPLLRRRQQRRLTGLVHQIVDPAMAALQKAKVRELRFSRHAQWRGVHQQIALPCQHRQLPPQVSIHIPSHRLFRMAAADGHRRTSTHQRPAHCRGRAAAAQHQHPLSRRRKRQRRHEARPVGIIAGGPALPHHNGIHGVHSRRVLLHRVQQRQDGLLMGHGHIEAVVSALLGPFHEGGQFPLPDGHRLIAACQSPLPQQRRMDGRRQTVGHRIADHAKSEHTLTLPVSSLPARPPAPAQRPAASPR